MQDHMGIILFFFLSKQKWEVPKEIKKKFIMYIGAINNYPDNQ